MRKFGGTAWESLQADLAKGVRQRALEIRNGRIVRGRSRGLPPGEDRRKYRLIALKLRLFQGISDIGARAYSLMWSKTKNLELDARIKDITARIRRYEAEIALLEQNLKKSARNRMGKAT